MPSRTLGSSSLSSNRDTFTLVLAEVTSAIFDVEEYLRGAIDEADATQVDEDEDEEEDTKKKPPALDSADDEDEEKNEVNKVLVAFLVELPTRIRFRCWLFGCLFEIRFERFDGNERRAQQQHRSRPG